MVERRSHEYGEFQLACRQRSERRINRDFEPLSETDAYRIAGALEIAGSAGFQLNISDGVSSPTCQMTEKRQDVLESFSEKDVDVVFMDIPDPDKAAKNVAPAIKNGPG